MARDATLARGAYGIAAQGLSGLVRFLIQGVQVHRIASGPVEAARFVNPAFFPGRVPYPVPGALRPGPRVQRRWGIVVPAARAYGGAARTTDQVGTGHPGRSLSLSATVRPEGAGRADTGGEPALRCSARDQQGSRRVHPDYPGRTKPPALPQDRGVPGLRPPGDLHGYARASVLDTKRVQRAAMPGWTGLDRSRNGATGPCSGAAGVPARGCPRFSAGARLGMRPGTGDPACLSCPSRPAADSLGGQRRRSPWNCTWYGSRNRTT